MSQQILFILHRAKLFILTEEDMSRKSLRAIIIKKFRDGPDPQARGHHCGGESNKKYLLRMNAEGIFFISMRLSHFDLSGLKRFAL